MISSHELAEKLRSVNVKALATEAGMSTKTIYRLRNPDGPAERGLRPHGTTLATVLRLLEAVKAVKRATPRRRTSAAGK